MHKYHKTTRVLITGIPGVGKTTVGKLLENHGFKFIDSDTEPGIGAWFNDSTGLRVDRIENANASWYESHSWNLNVDALWDLIIELEKTYKKIVVCGITSNISESFKFYDIVFLLKADHELIRQRMIDRSETPDLESIETVFEWADSFEQSVIKEGCAVIDASQSTEAIVKNILKITKSIDTR